MSPRYPQLKVALTMSALLVLFSQLSADENASVPSGSRPASASNNNADTADTVVLKKVAKETGAASFPGKDAPQVPDPKQVGGEADSVVQVANLIYAGVKSSQCFSDHFLAAAEKDSAISTSRRFHAVKLSSDEVFNFPLVIMTGEGQFELTPDERENLRQYLNRGGFLLASASCSSPEWNRSFRREMSGLFPDSPAEKLTFDHPVFSTVHRIEQLQAKHGEPKPLEGISIQGRLVMVYSEDGLNDTAHTQGCCCCGGNEITNCIDVNVNILAYALLF